MKKIRKNDEVKIIAGKDKGKIGKVLVVLKNNKLIVKGINSVKKCKKANPNTNEEGGFVTKDMPIDISNVMLYDPITKKGSRVGIRILADGKKERFYKSSGELVQAKE